MATGPGAEALAAAGRSHLQAFRGNIPTALLSALESSGLAVHSITLQGGVIGVEIRFLPQATEFVTPFLK